MDESKLYDKYEEFEKYEAPSSKPCNKHDNHYKKDECGEIKIYTHAVHIHVNCKHSKYCRD